MAWKEEGNRYGPGSWKRRETFTQPKPYRRNLPYLAFGGSTWKDYEPFPEAFDQVNDIANFVPLANGFMWGANSAGAVNKALDDLYDQMEQAESLRVAWKERGKAVEMITSGLRTIVTIARACKRRDPRIIRRILKRDPSKRDILKTPSDIWLAYYFGIVPTISDIHHAAGVFAHDPPIMKLEAKGSTAVPTFGGGNFMTYLLRTSVKLGGEVYQFDPNVSLASRLGFGQPLSVAWEMTPFSWFVDYFVNVGDLIKNLEPRFPGVKTRNEYTTMYQRYARTQFNFYGTTGSSSGFYLRRSLGWPDYQLDFPAAEGLKLQQCSYIAAVAIQLLSSFKK